MATALGAETEIDLSGWLPIVLAAGFVTISGWSYGRKGADVVEGA
jgi:hypothetical protein